MTEKKEDIAEEIKEEPKKKVVKGKDQPVETAKVLDKLADAIDKLAAKPNDEKAVKKVRTLVSKGLDEDMRNIKEKMEEQWNDGKKMKVKMEATAKFATWKMNFPPDTWNIPKKDMKEFLSYGDPAEVIINGYHVALPRGAYVQVPELIADLLEERDDRMHVNQQELYDKLREYKSQDPENK